MTAINPNTENKLIKKHMLEQELLDQLRSKDEKLQMSDFANDVQAAINGLPTGVDTYDDRELRGRIKTLEDGHVTAGDVFVKEVDRVHVKDLDGDLKNAYDYANEVPGLKVTKADKVYVDLNFRRTADPIQLADMDPSFKNTFEAIKKQSAEMYAKKLDNDAVEADIDNIQKDIVQLTTNKANKADLNNYRLKSVPLQKSDIATEIETGLNKIAALQNIVAQKADINYVNNTFRKKSDLLSLDDLDGTTKNRVLTAEGYYKDASSVVGNIAKGYYTANINWMKYNYGQPYYDPSTGINNLTYTDPLNSNAATNTQSNSGKSQNLTMASSGLTSAAAGYFGVPGSSLTFAALANYLYERFLAASSQYNSLLNSYNSLNSRYNSLLSNYNTLKSQADALK